MELFNELNDLEQFFIKENVLKLDCSLEKYQDLENKYCSLNETYEKESENSKKVEKCLVKCLKFYSKLRKKYERQQKIILGLEESIKEKVVALEESLKNQEKMKGLLQVYMTERNLYSGQSCEILRRDKEILLDVCCRLISESVKNNNIKSIINLILRKFRKDLDDEKLNLLKSKESALKKELNRVKDSEIFSKEDLKPGNFLKVEKLPGQDCPFQTPLSNCSSNIDEDCKKVNNEETNLDSKLDIKDQITENIKACETVGDNKLLDVRNCSENSKSPHPNSCGNEAGYLPNGGEKVSEGNLDSGNEPDSLRVLFDSTESEVGIMSYDSDDSESNDKPEAKEDDCLENYDTERSLVSLCDDKKLERGESKCEATASGSASLPKISSFSSDEANRCQLNFDYSVIPNVNKSADNISVLKDKSRDAGRTNDFSEGSFSACSASKGSVGDRSHSIGSMKTSKTETLSCRTGFSSHKPKLLDHPCLIPIERESNTNLRRDPEKSKNFVAPEPQPNAALPTSKDMELLNQPSSELFKSKNLDFINEKPQDWINKKSDILENIEDSEDSDLDEEATFSIFKEMETVRLLSPIKDLEISVETEKHFKSFSSHSSNSNKNLEGATDGESINKVTRCFTMSSVNHSKVQIGEKRKACSSLGFSKGSQSSNKKLKSETKSQTTNGGLLDSILSAMTDQNKEFKGNKNNKSSEEEEGRIFSFYSGTENQSSVNLSRPATLHFPETVLSKDGEVKNKNDVKRTENIHQEIGWKSKEKLEILEKIVTAEIKSFISKEISSKEEAQEYATHCVSVLKNKPEEIIAKTIVAVVLENVDERVEILERPAPPLTRTQQRLMVLLSILKTVDSGTEKISVLVRKILLEKFFPDKFFWPDDSVETATRFYAALCRTENDTRSFWKLCLLAVTEMKQRCCLVTFSALKTWPDVLLDASSFRNNLVSVTIVNVILHMPKADGLRNFNQKKKLLALKHLLMNFYQFKIEETIEMFTNKVFDMVTKDETGAEKALVLIAKARDYQWTCKHVLPKLKNVLNDWSQGKVEDALGNKILVVMKQIAEIVLQEKVGAITQVKDVISSLSQVLDSTKVSHDTEVTIIEILLKMKHYGEARRVIREWVPKTTISEGLRREIINVSAESVFGEMKLKEKKDGGKWEKKKRQNKSQKKKKKKSKKRKIPGTEGILNVRS